MGHAGVFDIRLAGPGDAADLRRLIEQSVRALSAGDYTPAQIAGALHHVLGLDTQLIEDQTYFVAIAREAPGRLAGCGGWSYRKTLYGSDSAPNREKSLLDPAADAAKIRAIFVHPDWARLGLGSLILKHCEEAAAHAGFRRFEMGSTLTGLPLYTLRGYQGAERVDITLPNAAVLPMLRMTKSL